MYLKTEEKEEEKEEVETELWARNKRRKQMFTQGSPATLLFTLVGGRLSKNNHLRLSTTYTVR